MNRVYGEPVEVHTEGGWPPASPVRVGGEKLRGPFRAGALGRQPGSGGLDPDPAQAHPELEFWRVEADHSRSKDNDHDHDQDAGTYELRRDVAADTWTLRRVAD